MKKVQRTFTAEFKREAVRLAQTSGLRQSRKWLASWAFRTRQFTSGASNWLPMETKPFRGAAIRRPRRSVES
jgi:hypothetical protein